MATTAADEPAEAMEQVEGDETIVATTDEAIEAMEQVEEEERAEIHAEVDAEPMEPAEEEVSVEIHAEMEADADADAMEQVEDEERVETHAEVEEAEAMEEVEEEERAETHAEVVEAEAMERVEEEERAEIDADVEEAEAEALQPALPVGRVKKIIRVDRDIRKVSGEAYLLITAATELFLGSLAAGAYTAATQSGRRTVRAAHVRAAARAHRPTADFLLDCLPAAAEPAVPSATAAAGAAAAKPLPRGTRRIDAFFQKVT